MSQEGFLFDELSEFKQNLMRDVQKNFPKETEKFIKQEAGKLVKVARKLQKKKLELQRGKKRIGLKQKVITKNSKSARLTNIRTICVVVLTTHRLMRI